MNLTQAMETVKRCLKSPTDFEAFGIIEANLSNSDLLLEVDANDDLLAAAANAEFDAAVSASATLGVANNDVLAGLDINPTFTGDPNATVDYSKDGGITSDATPETPQPSVTEAPALSSESTVSDATPETPQPTESVPQPESQPESQPEAQPETQAPAADAPASETV